jgi:hypothetical protein
MFKRRVNLGFLYEPDKLIVVKASQTINLEK